MHQPRTWRTRPVFITSTFVDMQAERDILRDKVFPALAERLRERFHHLEPIDLRWGVDNVSLEEAQEKDLLVLKVCLGEIQRSRPFLIGLIGDRYGWVPPAERMQTAIDGRIPDRRQRQERHRLGDRVRRPGQPGAAASQPVLLPRPAPL